MNNTPNTFLKLINKYSIEIPLIQRDYAQGRDDKKTTDIRSKFVSKLFSALAEEKDIELDFIYGPIHKNVFIPLDGQQRLTTLFLLHWYITKREEKESDCSNLRKFTYKVRTTTQEFLKALLSADKGQNLKLLKNPSKEIKDTSWYYSAWDVDPSVQGILTMLDAIHDKYGVKKRNLGDNLNRIKFNLLDMGEFNLTDDLYMKMNARGIPLTPFENFKAWLTDQCKPYENKNSFFYKGDDPEEKTQSWNWKIDKDWCDLFFQCVGEKMDDAYLSFFKTIALNAYVIKTEETDDTTKENVQRITKPEVYIPLDDYKSVYHLIDFQILTNAFKVLDQIIQLKISKEPSGSFFKEWKKLPETVPLFQKDSSDLFELLCKESQTYPQRVIIYGFFLYLSAESLPLKTSLTDWVRVVRNLTLNSQIDSPETFIRAIKGVSRLFSEMQQTGIIEFLASDNAKISGFRDGQIMEEHQKAKLIQANLDGLESILFKLENHPLLRGNINFLLKKSTEGELKYLPSNKIVEMLKKREPLVQLLWDESGSRYDRKNNYSCLLFRAMLVDGFFSDLQGELDFSNNQANWRLLLRNEKVILSYLKFLDAYYSLSAVELDQKLTDLTSSVKAQDKNLYHFINRNKELIYNKCLYMVFHRKEEHELLELRTSKGAWHQNRQFISQSRDQLIQNVLNRLEHQGVNALIVDRNGKDLTSSSTHTFFAHQWLTVAIPFFCDKNQKAHIAFSTDGINFEVGLRKTSRHDQIKSSEIIKLIESKQTILQTKNYKVDQDYWWWYAYKTLEADKNPDQIAGVLIELLEILKPSY